MNHNHHMHDDFTFLLIDLWRNLKMYEYLQRVKPIKSNFIHQKSLCSVDIFIDGRIEGFILWITRGYIKDQYNTSFSSMHPF